MQRDSPPGPQGSRFGDDLVFGRVAVTLSRPGPDLPTILAGCTGMIANPERLVVPEELATVMDGSGPYRYDADDSTPGSVYVFHRRSGYWNPDSYPFENAVFRVVPDPVARTPYLKDVRVRRALNHAIDRAAVNAGLFGNAGRPSAQIIPAAATGYDPALDNAYPHDIAKAKQLLNQAGYPRGFTLPVLSTPSFRCDTVLQAVAADWARIGVHVDVTVKPYDEYLQALTSRAYPAAVLPLTGLPSYTALAETFSERSPRNPFRTSDAALLDAFQQAHDPTGSDAAEGLHALSARLIDQAWYAGVGYDSVLWLCNPRKVTGIRMQRGEPVPHFYDWKPPADQLLR
ncbi:hypothetical protein KNE206_54260 [Kitasatospora sp. NE20-6]|uniref:ABC transporter substrate-binding protein n=1 Tax=Kitasatospora sp. NE20-6 TaxID=2859066 RepID=UPI0034DCC38D